MKKAKKSSKTKSSKKADIIKLAIVRDPVTHRRLHVPRPS